jgi:hypothetical protein
MVVENIFRVVGRDRGTVGWQGVVGAGRKNELSSLGYH